MNNENQNTNNHYGVSLTDKNREGSGYALQSFLPEKGQKRISTTIPNAKKSSL